MQQHHCDDYVILCVDGHLGRILLNRPQAINALSHSMVCTIRSALDKWATDDSVAAVAISGTGERGLCAGGDIVAMYRDAVSGGTDTFLFWADEYALNSLISTYPKPYVALMDGIVLGGGVGLSAHGQVRVVTERTKLGMPETGIGYVPDIGSTFLLSRSPNELGTHLALTGSTIAGADAIALGLADHFVHSARLDDLLAALATQSVDEAISQVAVDPPAAALIAEQQWIDQCYGLDHPSAILRALAARSEPGAQEAARILASRSPTAIAVTLASLRRARSMTHLSEALKQEFRVSARVFESHDFREGIRAQVIDKDRKPNWRPARLEHVSAELVDSFFANLGERELHLG